MVETEALIARIERAERLIHRVAVRNRSGGIFATDLTVQQLRLVVILAMEGDQSAVQLAEILGVGLTTLTGIVDRLETRSLVQRQPDPNDRRVRRISLTESGKQMVADFAEFGREHKQRILGRLEPRVLANLAEAVEAISELCREEFDADTDPRESPNSRVT
jgi:DNA-binding MarR family transcriptional regulator